MGPESLLGGLNAALTTQSCVIRSRLDLAGFGSWIEFGVGFVMVPRGVKLLEPLIHTAQA